MTARRSTARWTGVSYLVMAVAGLIGFLFVRSELFVESDAAATLANLVRRPSLARLGIVADLTVVVAQAITALWFLELFRARSGLAARSIAAFGLVNAGAVLVATAFSVAALVVAHDASLAPGGDQAATVQVLYRLGGALWDLGGVFFGLWLIPMGYAVAASRRMPSALGWVLGLGGVGYVLSTYLTQAFPGAPAAIEASLVGLATVGEFWMIGHLLFSRAGEPER
ncbi:MAG: DUF4386 domain-containing protein [Actinobacteria bacterium]|nr:DUF4386 domain-containing protein [Actinomycetota bacterium]